MTKQADTLRRKFAATDSSLRALQASWRRPDISKPPENIRKMAESLANSLDDLRPAFAGRGLTGPQLSPEERRAMLSRPEPEIVLQPITNRVTQLTDDLESFSAAPSKTQLEQIAVVKNAIAEAQRKLSALGLDVAKFDDAMNAVKVRRSFRCHRVRSTKGSAIIRTIRERLESELEAMD